MSYYHVDLLHHPDDIPVPPESSSAGLRLAVSAGNGLAWLCIGYLCGASASVALVMAFGGFACLAVVLGGNK